MDRLGLYLLRRPFWLFAAVFLGLAGLPVAVWMDLHNLSDQNLHRQVHSLDRVVTTVRAYYAQNVVGRVLSTDGITRPLHNYHDVPGAIPIPATLSLELGEAIGANAGIGYRFVSDYPFLNRPPHILSDQETATLAAFRAPGNEAREIIYETGGKLNDHTLVLATPVVMSGACVACHNAHPESPKHDWKVGDVRGIQTVSVTQPLKLEIWSFRYLLSYFAVAGSVGLMFAMLQMRLAARFSRLNDELSANNAFLADVSLKISKYLSPQVYKSIFSGEKDVEIATERKKLTVFFSDIKDFTATTEMLQPEELADLLNEYFTEMSRIAEAHGATIDKFIGDAIVAFFGDPTTRGTAEDARACVRMALDMQDRLDALDVIWRAKGLEHPFKARIGINTGYCNVGNFGSEDRMDYTIIGAEANLAARLESIADPGEIVMSFETYAHVRDIVDARSMDPVRFKGIAREIVPYRVVRRVSPGKSTADPAPMVLDLSGLDAETRARVRAAVEAAMADRRGKTAG